jgi:glycosyltransferase involved in cell wall biosynthesis
MKNSRPDFSIVTPSYNYKDYIKECLESVAKQKGVTFEHLVIDGASTDGTLEYLEEAEGIHLVSEPDRGMCDAINKGFDLAKGKWVIWLNSDDRLLPGALKAVLEFAEGRPDADVIYGGWNFVGKEGRFQKEMTLFPYSQRMMLYLGCYIGSTATFFRRDTVVESGERLNLSFQYVMDGELYARLSQKGYRFCYFPKVLADFRVHGENLSRRNYSRKDIDGHLTLQKQISESRAIRRSYGSVNFKNDHANCGVDALLYPVFLVWKFLLKRIFRLKGRQKSPLFRNKNM